jgi:hypothetical protein
LVELLVKPFQSIRRQSNNHQQRNQEQHPKIKMALKTMDSKFWFPIRILAFQSNYQRSQPWDLPVRYTKHIGQSSKAN